MTPTLWLSLAAICALGAISPGPSLAVVLRHTLSNGRGHGILSALSHAVGVALWATLTILGLALLVAQTPLLYFLLTYAGAAYLAWMGIKSLRSKESPLFEAESSPAPFAEAARDGFMISMLNPKLALFFISLFSQFVSADLSRTEQLAMITTAALIDGLWYSIAVVLLSTSGMRRRLQKQSQTIDRISGILFIGLALRVVAL